jgi:hypothetical protein
LEYSNIMALNRGISIFGRECTWKKTKMLPFPHLVSASSLIRGNQIVDYLGGKWNPKEGYENDVCIYIKPHPDNFTWIKDGSWIDICDVEGYLVGILNDRPGLNAIVASDYNWNRYGADLKNKKVLIPQQHCNFDRELRTRKSIETVGFIGGELGFYSTEEDMRKIVEGAGFNFLWVTRYKTRQDVIDFYKEIDIQLVWGYPSRKRGRQTVAPLKPINAASFGIPTVAYPQASYIEVDGYYIKANTLDEIPVELNKLRDVAYYDEWASKIIPFAEKYHISKIAELYRALT